MKYGKIIQFFLSLIIPTTLYVYYYPWLYNKVNQFTERGEDLDDQMDFVNVLIMFIGQALFTIFIIAPLIMKVWLLKFR
jgi:hypothetical protein